MFDIVVCVYMDVMWSYGCVVSQETPVLLFPSKDCFHAKEFIAAFNAGTVLSAAKAETASTASGNASDAAAGAGGAPERLLHLLVVDGTWQQAKKMCKMLSSRMPCIRIDVPDHTATLYTALRKVSEFP